MDHTQAKRVAEAAVDRQAERLKAISRQLYEHPELGHQEHRSAALLADYLEAAGYSVARCVAGLETGFIAEWPPSPAVETPGHSDTPTVAILAEYDALPGIGHGCGHNLIGTMAVGAGVALTQIDSLPGRVLVIGCPAEEGGVEGAGGKVVLVEAGAFDTVDAAIMAHPAGVDGVSGPSSCRMALEVDFIGKTAHAAGAPYEGLNALEAVIQTFNGINALRQHLPGSVKVHGVVVKGGEAPNVIPDQGRIRLYVRAMSEVVMRESADRVQDCARGAALATGCQVRFREFAHTYLDMIPSAALDEAFAANMAALGRPPLRRWRPGGGVGSTDMGNVSHVVPSIHPYISISAGGPASTSHSREFAEATQSPGGQAALLVGAKALAMTAVDFFYSADLRREVRAGGPLRAVDR